MGSGSSILPNDHHNSVRRPDRKSIRQQFEKEFGKAIKEDNQIESHENEKFEVVSTNKNREIHADLPELSDGLLNPAVFHAKKLFMRPIIKKRPIQDKLVVKKQNNHALLKEIYRRMDPTINTVSMQTVVGEIELAAKFKPEDKTLLVKVGRAKNLSVEGLSGLPDPYCVVDIFPINNPLEITTRKTKIKTNTCNPYFQEILTFPMTQQQISHTKLRVTIWDKVNHSTDDFLGESLLDICKLDLNIGSIIWYRLYPKTDVSFSGNIEIGIKFIKPRSLVINVIQANGVKACDDQKSNPYVRIYVTGLPNKLETSVKSGTLDPVWNESFEFDVHPSEFPRRIIVMNLLSKNNSGGRDKHLGDVHVPLDNFDFENDGVSKKYPLEDLRNTPYTRSKWSEEGLAIEFSEAMRAHMTYGYPKFIFKKYENGKMMVSCRSEKARTQVKMILENGIPTRDEVQM